MKLKRIVSVVSLAVLSLWACIGVSCPAWSASTFNLVVVTSSGVTGNPVLTNHTYASGATVPYSYTAATGYSAAVVVLDGQIAPASGSITMSADHWLYAYGTPATGTSFNNMVTVPSDVTKIKYPDFYQNRAASTVKVADPYCALTSDTVSFPASYLGSFPLPTISGAPLPPSVKRGASMKDYWGYGLTDASTNAGCTGSLHDAMIASMKRLKAVGVDHINVYRDTEVIDWNAPTLTIRDVGSWSISASELQWITQQAAAFGLKVYDFRQINPNDSKNVFTNQQTPTLAALTLFYDAYIPWIVDRAKEAEAAGVAAFQLDCGELWFANWNQDPYKSLVLSKLATAAQQVRAVYSGKIVYGQYNFSPPASGNADLYANIDWIFGESTADGLTLSDTENQNISVSLLKQKYSSRINDLANQYSGVPLKPVLWELFTQSYRDWFKNGWIEDGFCTNNCQQNNLQIDFSVQAISYEAALEAITAQTQFQTVSVDAKAYWYVDVILPKDSFPSHSQSWRNKPAEAVLTQWFAKAPDVGAVFSSAQQSSQSFIRLYNSGLNAGTATVTLRDYTTGQSLGQWTSPTIAAGAEQQFQIGTIENGAGSFTKPSYYSASVQANFTGYVQHVLWRPSDGTLTNLSTCDTGTVTDGTRLDGVHSSLLSSGYPSSIVVTNTGSAAAQATLDLLDARDGTALGTYTTASIPSGGELVLPVTAIEASIRLSPAAGMYHYNVQVEGGFTGFLQHLVNNTQVGVVTDMTTACSLSGQGAAAATAPLNEGAIFSTAQSASQSFLRFFNTGSSAGTVSVALRDYTTGQTLGTWTSPSIAPLSEQQFPISTVESAVNISGSKPSYYAINVQSNISGYFQHVLWRPADGTLTNLSTCANGVTADQTRLGGIHTATIGSGFPSSIVINNTGTVAETATLGIYDARNGTKLGTYTSASIPAGGQLIPTVTDIEAGAHVTPTTAMFHYVIKTDKAFTGFLQHLVNNTKVGVITDMTPACAFAVSGS